MDCTKNEQLKVIANSYAEEYRSDAIYPAHLFKAILHKEMGLVRFPSLSNCRWMSVP